MLNKRARSFSIMPKTLDENTGMVQAVVATQDPVSVPDYARGEMVDEVLLMSGVKLPMNNATPLLNSHKASGIENIIGSARNYRVEGGNLVADLIFSSDSFGQSALAKVREGHLKDLSVGYEVHSATFVPDGQVAKFDGKEFRGPVKIATSWWPYESSLTPIGADEMAKVRSKKQGITSASRAENNQGGSFKMNKRLYNLLLSRGLAAGATEDEALDFLGKLPNAAHRQIMEAFEAAEKAEKTETAEERAKLEQVAQDRGQRIEGERQAAIRELCKSIPACADLETELIADPKATVENCGNRIAAHLAKGKPPIGVVAKVEMGVTDLEKFQARAMDAMLLRAGVPVAKPAEGAHELMGMTMVRMAEEFLSRAGIRVGSFDSNEIAKRAMTSSDFPNLLSNIVNKSISTYNALFMDQQTWRRWCAVGTLSDFKAGSRVIMSGFGAAQAVTERGEYDYLYMGETKEPIQASTKGGKVSITRQMLVNDDKNAFNELPRMLVLSCIRAVADQVYAYLTSNTNMTSDGLALCNTVAYSVGTDGIVDGHANQASSAALSITTMGELRKMIRVQKDLKGNSLNTPSRILLVPAALEMSGQYHTGPQFSSTTNPGNYANPFAGTELVVEGRLDASSATAYWMLADPSIVPTIEVGFVNGVQVPYVSTMTGRSPDVLDLFGSIDFGTCIRDFRGIAKNPGA